MLNKYSDYCLVTPTTLYKTVMNDGQTRLWFRKLLTSPQVRRKLCVSADMAKEYMYYRAWSAISLLLWGLSVLIMMLGGGYAIYNLAVVVSAGVLVGCMAACCGWKARYSLARMAAGFLEKEKDTVSKGMTLYQLGEIWSRQYGVPSLVDVIWMWDQWLRKVFLALYLGTIGVYFLSFGMLLFWLISGCYLTTVLVKAVIFSKRNH